MKIATYVWVLLRWNSIQLEDIQQIIKLAVDVTADCELLPLDNDSTVKTSLEQKRCRDLLEER